MMPEPVGLRSTSSARSSLAMLAGSVAGAAVAAAHLRHDQGRRLLEQLPGLFWLLFAFLTLASAGPFVLLARANIYGSRLSWGWSWRWNWAAMAVPWLLSLPWAGSPRSIGRPHMPSGSYEGLLMLGTIVGALLLAVLSYGASRAKS
jgi:hypothetical protein